ncbi:hypothetical protein G0Q06_08260 [Puniceicoccales bacterium CK1056]|uniref:Uncharacterized protein n=1 Tax=Oceanipulchritudo coccoides TaxID=2706888 RepID=A0A6B2M2L5_9BACT|nr:hypothetical protein [Oceanipulchritudo coccoides]NDV62439.1 hypothetical protein [Oceanipulchritudo coccoides]
MEVPIKSVGEQSFVSGKAFVPGDRVWSCLYRTDEGVLERVDVLEEEREQLNLDAGVLCKWSQMIKEREISEAEVRKADLQSTDEIFLSLYDELEEDGDDSAEIRETRDRLKFFLALQLERKRVLKPLGRGKFRHMPTKREFEVPQLELTPELVAAHLKPEMPEDSGQDAAGEDDTEVTPPEEDNAATEGLAEPGPEAIKKD